MNGTYNFSCLNTGFPDSMLNVLDIFGCAAAAPLISQAPLNQPPLGYSQAYMQEIFTIKERCKGLETQLMMVTTERNTLNMMLDQLSTSLQKPMMMASMTKTAEMYLNLCFWTQCQYNEWTNTPKAHGNTRYKFAFIEDEQGTTVPDRILKAIRKTIRGCWAELVNKGMAPKTWGKANTSVKEVVFLSMYKSFPFLQLAENDWKIDLVCSLDYPGWVHNNLDDKGNWVASCRVKQEDEAAAGDE